MNNQEKPSKVAKILQLKAEEFLSNRKYADNLVDIVNHYKSGADLSACLVTLEYIFTCLLKEQEMFIHVIPLKPLEKTPEVQYKQWLQEVYEKSFTAMSSSLESNSPRIQIQGLTSLMNILSFEAKYPLRTKVPLDGAIPSAKLKNILNKILSTTGSTTHLINKYCEYLANDDVLFFTWKILPTITAKSNPNDTYIMNYLLLLGKLHVSKNTETILLSSDEDNFSQFNYDEVVVRKCLNKMWNCIILWEHTPATHKQLLIVLLESVLSYLDKPVLMTDFLMDSLDVGGPVSLLALQGIFTLIQVHNLNYPNIYTKLYSMFEPEIFHTKFKSRLFYLSDLFLTSSHLPETLVAAFAKRLSRLALVAPSEDIATICMFVGNLILRHPGLKCLLNNSKCDSASNDPYIMDESDPLKSCGNESSLWEIKTLQEHVLPTVANAAKFINFPLPKVEWDFTRILDNTADDIFDKEIKKYSGMIALAFNRPYGLSYKGDKVSMYWNL